MKKYLSISIFIAIIALAGFYFAGKVKKVAINKLQVAIDGGQQPVDIIQEEKNTPKNESAISEEKKDPAEMIKVEPKDESAVAVAKENEKPSSNLPEIKNKLVSFGYQKSSGRKIDTIIIHSSYNSLGGDQYDVDKIIDIYRSYGVAAHYLIDREGKIYRLVEEKNIAYHAGVSSVPDGRTGVNNFSIGIELVNSKSDKYTEKQYEALKNLVADIKGRYKIEYALGHNQIAPGRKDDPWNFEWGELK